MVALNYKRHSCAIINTGYRRRKVTMKDSGFRGRVFLLEKLRQLRHPLDIRFFQLLDSSGWLRRCLAFLSISFGLVCRFFIFGRWRDCRYHRKFLQWLDVCVERIETMKQVLFSVTSFVERMLDSLEFWKQFLTQMWWQILWDEIASQLHSTSY